MNIKYNCQPEEIKTIYEQPFINLLLKAQLTHREFHNPLELQPARLQSIKTGACPEDCKYCPQSSHHKAPIEKEALYPIEKTLEIAKEAKKNGATRFCMGLAWRKITDGKQFDTVLETVKQIDKLGLEVCLTAGMLTKEQAIRLKEAGLVSYNHNLDTSKEFYPNIITTRTYQDRLDTIEHVRNSGVTVCCGGILGLGESIDDRISLLAQLASFNPHPESVPVNILAKYENMPLNHVEKVNHIDIVRFIATARIIMPKSIIRLSAGRIEMSDEQQAMCFFAGVNSVFTASDKLFITENPNMDNDSILLNKLGMKFTKNRLIKGGSIDDF